MTKTYRSALLAILMAPTLLGFACEPDVDLGHNPDAGPTPAGDGGPMADAGPVLDDGGPVPIDAGPPLPAGAVTIDASSMLLDVFDGAASTLSFDLSIEIEDASGRAHDVRPRRYELLAADGSVLSSYPLDGAPATMTGSSSGTQSYADFGVSPLDSVGAPLMRACAGDGFLSLPSTAGTSRASSRCSP